MILQSIEDSKNYEILLENKIIIKKFKKPNTKEGENMEEYILGLGGWSSPCAETVS